MAEQKGKSSGKDRIGDGEAVNGVVEQLMGRTGARGEITQVTVKILSGRNEGKSMRRNVKGAVRIGDLLTMRETEIEARRINTSRRRSV